MNEKDSSPLVNFLNGCMLDITIYTMLAIVPLTIYAINKSHHEESQPQTTIIREHPVEPQMSVRESYNLRSRAYDYNKEGINL